MSDELVPLEEAIASLRREIVAAAENARHEEIVFSLQDIELELAVVARRSTSADGKLKFSILGIGAEGGGAGSVGQERTQRVRIKLQARRRGSGTDLEIAHRTSPARD
jgi:hypothetical protein